MTLTDYYENLLIDKMFRGQAGLLPATLWIGLYTSTPSDNGGGVEVAGNNYSRVSFTPNLTNFCGTQGLSTTTASSGASGVVYNNVSFTFNSPTPSTWGSIVSIGFFTAVTGGNLLFYCGVLPAPITTPVDIPVVLLAGQLSLSLGTTA